MCNSQCATVNVQQSMCNRWHTFLYMYYIHVLSSSCMTPLFFLFILIRKHYGCSEPVTIKLKWNINYAAIHVSVYYNIWRIYYLMVFCLLLFQFERVWNSAKGRRKGQAYDFKVNIIFKIKSLLICLKGKET